jgi:dipeptidase D
MLAARTRASCSEDVEELLGELVAFETYHREGTDNAEQPAFQEMSRWLKNFADRSGLGFADHGNVVVVSLAGGPERLGVIAHGDVQPADPKKWAKSPFSLDTGSEPGRLVGRGTEDDKGPLACALIAMRELRATGWPLARTVELIISFTEESDWAPFQKFLESNPPPPLNVGFDADYPVVVAEKGWCSVMVSLPAQAEQSRGSNIASEARLSSFTGGFFLSQVPEDAVARIDHATAEVRSVLKAAVAEDSEVRFSFEQDGEQLIVRAHGTSAHSSLPEKGRNGITHLARVLGAWDWPDSTQAFMVRFINERIGVGFYGELFGDLAYSDEFMGPLTLSLGTLREESGALVAGINVRRPEGRSSQEVEESLRDAVKSWSESHGMTGLELEMSVREPHRVHGAPHVPVLLNTFRHYTGITDAEPLSIGGGTHASMVPYGVNFGPAMPGELYTGHSEHEFITRDQLQQNLEMYTSLLVDLSVK